MTDAGVVLARLRVALARAEQVGADTAEAETELGALADEASPAEISASSILPEIDAVAQRLSTLAEAHDRDDWQVRETAEHTAEVLRVLRADALRSRLDTDALAALLFIEEVLTASEQDIESLVGANPGDLDAWRRGKIPKARSERVRLAAQVVLELQRSMTTEDILLWFSDERARLNGHTPNQVLDAGSKQDKSRLLSLAQAPHSILAA